MRESVQCRCCGMASSCMGSTSINLLRGAGWDEASNIVYIVCLFLISLQYLGHVEVDESRGMHICEDAVKRLKTVRVLLQSSAFYFPFLGSQDASTCTIWLVYIQLLWSFLDGLLFFLPLSSHTFPFLSSHQASQLCSVDPNLCSSLEHKVTLCSTCITHTPGWAVHLAPRYPSLSSPPSNPPVM